MLVPPPFMPFKCTHPDLLEAHSYCVADTDRLTRLASELDDATRQCPLVVLCLGNVSKNQTLPFLFRRHTNSRKRRPAADVYLDSETSESATPIYYVDVDPSASPRNGPEIAKCHELRSHRIEWQSPESLSLQDLVLTRLVFLITDVICVFADDIGGLAAVECLLARWTKCGSASSLPTIVKPRIVVFTEASDDSSTQLQYESIMALSKRAEFQDMFSAIRIEVSDKTELRTIIKGEELRLACTAKTASNLLFSAKHVSWIYRHGMEHFCQTYEAPFDHYSCLVTRKLELPQLIAHMDAFLGLVDWNDEAVDPSVMVTYLASSFLIHMYPPGGHGFTSSVLFEKCFITLFRRMLQSNSVHAILPTLAEQVQTDIVSMAPSIGFNTTARTVHSRNLLSIAGRLPWSTLQSNTSCLGCLRNRPEHCMDCRHALCDDCVVYWGSALVAREYTYRFAKCPLCQRPTRTTVTLKPPTAGIRLVSIDGGGVRGIVPLRMFEMIQNEVAPCDNLQEFFDLACGTSSGGLDVLGLFAMKWPVAQCISTFERLATDIFTRSPRSSWLSQMGTYVNGFFRDSMYDAKQLEQYLQLQFGRFSCLFDKAPDGHSKFKIVVTATNISTSSTYVLSNYNGHGSSERRNGYQHVRSRSTAEEVKLWQAARATTAAPFLFPPVDLPIGTLQDGGTREHNNPTQLAMWEARQLWPESTMLDVVLSLGTGSIICSSPGAPCYRDKLRDGSILRTVRSYISGIDGEVQSRNTVNSLDMDTKSGWFRFNIKSDVRLDDAEALHALRESVEDHKQDLNILALHRALVASSFFFELDRLPNLNSHGLFLCEGHIRLRGDKTVVLAALQGLLDAKARFFKGRHLLAELDLNRPSICHKCKMFSIPIAFNTRHMEERITITLHTGGGATEQRISGFPQTMSWFVHQQNLDSCYSTQQKPCACRSRGTLPPMIPKRRSTLRHNHHIGPYHAGASDGKKRKLDLISSWL